MLPRFSLQILLKELQADAYSDGLRDQNAVIYLLKTHPEWQDRVLFQDKEICLNCYWQDLIGVTGYGKPTYDRLENVSLQCGCSPGHYGQEDPNEISFTWDCQVSP